MQTLFPVCRHGRTKAHSYKCFINATFAHQSTTLTNWRYQINWSVIHCVGFLTAFLAEWDRASSSWASDWWGNANEGVSGIQWGPEASTCPLRFQPMSSESHNALPSLRCRAGKSSGKSLTLQVNLYFCFTSNLESKTLGLCSFLTRLSPGTGFVFGFYPAGPKQRTD